MTEAELLYKSCQGDTRAYAELIDLHKDLAFAIAYRISLNTEDAEEITQDAFLKAYLNIHRFKGKSKFSTWVYRIVYNAAVSKTRGRKKNLYLGELPAIEEKDVEHPLEQLESEERTKLMQEAMAMLEHDENTLLTLFYWEDIDVKEMAEITGLSESNVKVKMFRARKKLYHILKTKFETEYNTGKYKD